MSFRTGRGVARLGLANFFIKGRWRIERCKSQPLRGGRITGVAAAKVEIIGAMAERLSQLIEGDVDARVWIDSESNQTGSFLNTCDALNLDATEIRERFSPTSLRYMRRAELVRISHALREV